MPTTRLLPLKDRTSLALSTRGLIAETFPVGTSTSNSTATAGSWFGGIVGLRAGDVVTGLGVIVAGNATTSTLVKLGLWSSAGTLLASTADQSASFNAGAANRFQSAALSSAYTVTADGGYYLGIVCVGGTGPSLFRGSAGASVQMNSGAFNHATATGQTDAATVTPATASLCFYVAAY